MYRKTAGGDIYKKTVTSRTFAASSALIARGPHWPAQARGGHQAAGSFESNLQIHVMRRYFLHLIFNEDKIEFVPVHHPGRLPLVSESLAFICSPFFKGDDVVDRHCLAKLDHRKQERWRTFQVRGSSTRGHPKPAGSDGAGKSFVKVIAISLVLAI